MYMQHDIFSGNDYVINTFPDARDPETQNVMRFYSPSRRVLEFIEKVKSELEKAKTELQGGASPVRIGHLALILQSLDVEVMFFCVSLQKQGFYKALLNRPLVCVVVFMESSSSLVGRLE